MRQVRRGLFETNSSSTHSLTMCSGDEFRRWENGELLFDRWNEEFVEASSVKTGHNMDKVKETYEEVRGNLWKNFDDLTEAEIADFCEEYFEEDDDNQYVTYEWYFDHYEYYFDTFEDSYTTKNGDEVVCFGYFGYDG